MDPELSEDQTELRQAAAGMLDRYAPLSLARQFLDAPVTEGTQELWAQIAQLGWLGVGLEEDDPFGVTGLCLLAAQVGRHAAPTTLVDTALVARVASAAGSPWAERIVAGDPPLALALLEPESSWLASSTATLVRRGAGFTVSGVKTGVHHASAVGRLAVIAELHGAPVIALLDATANGVSIHSLAGLDPPAAPARVVLEGVHVPEDDVLAGPAVAQELAHALDVAAVATTAEGLGAAGAALELAVAYALEREQYGHLIGSFQAVKHILAEAHARRETAWAAVLHAAAALEERTDGAPLASAVAKAHGAASAKEVVEAALQVFGGIGFTREHDLHLLYRRAIECAERFGGVVEHERRVAETLLSPKPALAGR